VINFADEGLFKMASTRVEAQGPPAPTLLEQMSKHGITRSSCDVFHVDGFRYSNLVDAIAQGKRTKPHISVGTGSDWHSW
jgi:hypothetical protein